MAVQLLGQPFCYALEKQNKNIYVEGTVMNNWLEWDSRTGLRFLVLALVALIISMSLAFCAGTAVQGHMEEPSVETIMFYPVEE